MERANHVISVSATAGRKSKIKTCCTLLKTEYSDRREMAGCGEKS